MRKEILKTAVLFIALLGLQLYAVPYIAIGFAAPNLPVILLVFVALREGQIRGTVTGFLFGMVLDFVSGGVVGSGMFSFTIAGFTAGYFFDANRIDEEIPFGKLLGIIFFSALVNNFFYSILGTREVTDMTVIFVEQSLLSAFYTALISILLLVFRRR